MEKTDEPLMMLWLRNTLSYKNGIHQRDLIKSHGHDLLVIWQGRVCYELCILFPISQVHVMQPCQSLVAAYHLVSASWGMQ